MADPITLSALAMKFGPSVLSGIGKGLGFLSGNKKEKEEQKRNAEKERYDRFVAERSFNEDRRREGMDRAEKEGFRSNLLERLNSGPGPRANLSSLTTPYTSRNPFSSDAGGGRTSSLLDAALGPQREYSPIELGKDAFYDKNANTESFDQAEARKKLEAQQKTASAMAGSKNKLFSKMGNSLQNKLRMV